MDTATKTVVAREAATEEVNAWLNHKRMPQWRRDQKADAIESLINCVMDGSVTIDKDKNFELTQHLIWEVGEEAKISKLVWKAVSIVARLKSHMKGVESADFTGNCIAQCCAQTGQPKAVIENLNDQDLANLKAIAVFFL